MIYRAFLILASIASLVFSGCANPSYSNLRQDFAPKGWSNIAIMPFAGDARFTEVATQTFAIHILGVNGFRVIQPNTTIVSLKELGIAQNPNGFTVVEAQKVGRAVNADAIVVGTVTSYNNGATGNGFCTAQIIDVQTGEIVGACHNPSGLLVANSEHQAVMAATQRTGKEILKMLNDLAYKNRTSAVSPSLAKSSSETKGSFE